MEKEGKIRKMLGKRFHLSVSLEGEKLETTKWKLFRKYENGDPIYYSKDNKAIMTSETHTEEDLYKFAKSHKKYDLYETNKKERILILSIMIVLATINMFINLNTISIIVLTVDFTIMFQMFIEIFIDNKNFKVDMLEMRENFHSLIKNNGEDNECNREDNTSSRNIK